MNEPTITVALSVRMLSEMGPIMEDAVGVPDDHPDEYLVAMRDLSVAIDGGRRTSRGVSVTLTGRYLIETMRAEAEFRQHQCMEQSYVEGVGQRALSTAFRNLRVRCMLALEGVVS